MDSSSFDSRESEEGLWRPEQRTAPGGAHECHSLYEQEVKYPLSFHSSRNSIPDFGYTAHLLLVEISDPRTSCLDVGSPPAANL